MKGLTAMAPEDHDENGHGGEIFLKQFVRRHRG
jgi:hypothetical protein